MSDHNDVLIQLRDVGVTQPRAGDSGDERIWDELAREIGRRQHSRRDRRRRRSRISIRHRAAVRGTALGAVTALAAAALVVATGVIGGSSPAPSRVTFPSAPASQLGSGATQDTAFVVNRVRATVAAAAANGTIVHAVDYYGGHVAVDGSIVDPGWRQDAWNEYAAPDGSQYAHGELFYRDGRREQTIFQAWTPDADSARGTLTQTALTPRAGEYSSTTYPRSFSPNVGRAPNLFSSPTQVQNALRSGQVTEHGTTTVDGMRAIVLSMVVANAPGNPSTAVALYVDARTYQPLRMVSFQPGYPDISVADWRPATPAAIAGIKEVSIPAGDARVSALEADEATWHR